MIDETSRWYQERRDDPRSAGELIAAALMETDEHVWWRLVGILQVKASEEVLHGALCLCRSDCPSERELGVSILGQVGAPERAYVEESMDALLEMLQRETDAEVLATICFAVGHRGDARAVPHLVDLKDHPSADIRYAVVHGLMTHPDSAAIESLIELSQCEDSDVRDWATFALGSQIDTDTPEIREALARRLSDPDDDTRGEALTGLARRKDSRVFEPLQAELQSEFVRWYAVEAAQELGDTRLLRSLLDLSEWWDVNPDLLEKAIAACR
jgi:HEAT repeat protein